MDAAQQPSREPTSTLPGGGRLLFNEAITTAASKDLPLLSGERLRSTCASFQVSASMNGLQLVATTPQPTNKGKPFLLKSSYHLFLGLLDTPPDPNDDYSGVVVIEPATAPSTRPTFNVYVRPRHHFCSPTTWLFQKIALDAIQDKSRNSFREPPMWCLWVSGIHRAIKRHNIAVPVMMGEKGAYIPDSVISAVFGLRPHSFAVLLRWASHVHWALTNDQSLPGLPIPGRDTAANLAFDAMLFDTCPVRKTLSTPGLEILASSWRTLVYCCSSTISKNIFL